MKKKTMGLGRMEDVFREDMKNPRFRRMVEKERRGLFLAYRILTLRQKLGLSQKKLAARMKTSQQAVARLESGSYEGFTLRTLENVAEALGARLVIDLKKGHRKPAS